MWVESSQGAWHLRQPLESEMFLLKMLALEFTRSFRRSQPREQLIYARGDELYAPAEAPVLVGVGVSEILQQKQQKIQLSGGNRGKAIP